MNVLCRSFLRKSFSLAHRPFGTTNSSFLFASSKYSKPNKNESPESQKSGNKQILKASPKAMDQGKNSKSNIPEGYKPKSGSIMSQEEKKELALQQKLQACYTQIQSFPSDSYETVVQNYKRVKTRLNDRKVYIPNKPQLLMQIDKSMELIKEHHKVFRAPSTQIERSPTDTKKEVIEFQLEQAKRKYYLSLLEDERFLIGLAATVILLTGATQYYFFILEEQDPTLELPKMFL